VKIKGLLNGYLTIYSHCPVLVGFRKNLTSI